MSDLPRLLLCSFDVIPGPSGSSRRLTEYLKALPDRFSVVVLSAKTPDHSHIEKYQGARLLRVPVGSGDLVSRIQTFERAVRRQLDSEEYALAHFTDPFGGYVLCETKGDYGYRLIYEAQTFPSQELRYTHPQTESDKRFLAKVRRQELFCLMNADLVITGSQTTRSYIQSLGASTEQIRVIRAPVDLGPYTPDVVGVPDGRPMRLMYLGSQAGWQGLPILLRALALAVEQGAEVKLTLVGARHPDWQPHLEDLAKELGILEHVEFQAPVLHDDLVKVLALADVGVLPLDDVDRNRLQGGPLAKVSEYFAAGRPVLAADLPVTRELLPSSAVLFHTAGDAKALAENILELSRDVPRRLQMGREARAFAEETLDAGLVRGKLLDIYDELLGKQRVTATEAATELPAPTMTGTPTNRISQIKPPEGGGAKRSSRKGGSEKGKGSSKKSKSKEDLPLVVGQELVDDGMDTRLIKTEPDARTNEPPVVMGRPLRDSAPAESPTAEEPPTSIVTAAASEPETSDRTPTPIVRAPIGPLPEAPPAATPRAPVPVPEEPPAPTPIVPMKNVAGAPQVTGASRSEPEPQRPPMAVGKAKTGTRKAFQEPAREPEPSEKARAEASEKARVESSDKSRAASLPPLARAVPPPPDTRGPPPRLEPTLPPIVRPSPPEPSAPVSPRASAPAEPVLPPIVRPSPPEPSAPVSPRAAAPAESVLPPIVRPPPPEPSAPPVLRASPPSEPAVPPAPRTAPPVLPTPPPLPRSALPPRPSGSTPPVVAPPPAAAREEEPEELSEAEAQEISDEAPLDAAPTPPHPHKRVQESKALDPDDLEEADAEPVEAADDDLEEADAEPVEAADDDLEEADAEPVEAADDDLEEADAEPVEAADDDLEEADAAEAIETPDDEDEAAFKTLPMKLPPAGASPAQAAAPPEEALQPAPLDSALDPWFAQLAHGYCPPEGAQFARHTPPTNFPGRDEEPTDPTRVPPSPVIQGASRGKRS